jgi:predicted component of type VI protein secretion system
VNPVVKIQMRCDGEAWAQEFATFPVRIGREPVCELRLDHSFVSRQHARIDRVGDALVVVDEGSRNGVVCNGQRLKPHTPVPLGDGSEIRIKRFVARVRVGEPTAFVDPVAMLSHEPTQLAERTSPNIDLLLEGLIQDGAAAPNPSDAAPGPETAPPSVARLLVGGPAIRVRRLLVAGLLRVWALATRCLRRTLGASSSPGAR